MEPQGELKPRWEVTNKENGKIPPDHKIKIAGSSVGDDSHAVVILSDFESSVCQQSWLQGCLPFASVSGLLPISYADPAVHRAVNWPVEILQVNQTKTLEPLPRLFILLRFALFYWNYSQHYPANTVIRELEELLGLGVNYLCSSGKCASKYVSRLVTIYNNSMWLCVCPSEQETSCLNNTTAFKFCDSLVNGIFFTPHAWGKLGVFSSDLYLRLGWPAGTAYIRIFLIPFGSLVQDNLAASEQVLCVHGYPVCFQVPVEH